MLCAYRVFRIKRSKLMTSDGSMIKKSTIIYRLITTVIVTGVYEVNSKIRVKSQLQFKQKISFLPFDCYFHVQYSLPPPLERFIYPSSCGTTFRFSVKRSLPSITPSPNIMISVAAKVKLYSTKETVGAGYTKQSMLIHPLHKDFHCIAEISVPKFPSVAESYFPSNIRTDPTNQLLM